jgi:hypothetical protein
MKKSGVKPHQVDEQVSDANMGRRHLIQGALLSTVAASAPVEAAEQSAHDHVFPLTRARLLFERPGTKNAPRPQRHFPPYARAHNAGAQGGK